MERFGVETFDYLSGEAVRRLVPGYETLELVDPGNVIETRSVRLRGGGRPLHLRAA